MNDELIESGSTLGHNQQPHRLAPSGEGLLDRPASGYQFVCLADELARVDVGRAWRARVEGPRRPALAPGRPVAPAVRARPTRSVLVWPATGTSIEGRPGIASRTVLPGTIARRTIARRAILPSWAELTGRSIREGPIFTTGTLIRWPI